MVTNVTFRDWHLSDPMSTRYAVWRPHRRSLWFRTNRGPKIRGEDKRCPQGTKRRASHPVSEVVNRRANPRKHCSMLVYPGASLPLLYDYRLWNKATPAVSGHHLQHSPCCPRANSYPGVITRAPEIQRNATSFTPKKEKKVRTI